LKATLEKGPTDGWIIGSNDVATIMDSEEFGMSDLKNRVALVTGGSRGIGRAIALALAEAGAAVAVNYREREEEAGAVAEDIRKSGGRVAVLRADVSLRIAVQSMVHDIEERLGPIDILINNAGMAVVYGDSRTLRKRISTAPSRSI